MLVNKYPARDTEPRGQHPGGSALAAVLRYPWYTVVVRESSEPEAATELAKSCVSIGSNTSL